MIPRRHLLTCIFGILGILGILALAGPPAGPRPPAMLIVDGAPPESATHAPPAPPAPPGPGPRQSSPWWLMPHGRFTVKYTDRYPADAQPMADLTDLSLTALIEEFSDLRFEEDLAKVGLEIRLEPQITQWASKVHSSMTPHLDAQERLVMEIHMLTPSAYGTPDESGFPPERNRDRFHLEMTRELSAIFLGGVNASKLGGWKLFESPDWFQKGYRHYLALTRSSLYNRTIRLAECKATLREDRVRVAADFRVADDEIDGALLVLFMHETWGRERMHALLKSSERSFWDAVRSVLGVTQAELHTRWLEWREQARTPREQ